jgi:hypothetical protein
MASTMHDPWPEDVRRTLDTCRRDSAWDVLASRAWAQLRGHCGALVVELDVLGHRTISQRVDRDYARLHEQMRRVAAARGPVIDLLLADAIEELASTLAGLHRFHSRMIAAGAPARQISDSEAMRPAGDVAVLDQAGGPEPDPHHTGKACWMGKCIYLGTNSQVSRLFWLLAKPVGAAHSVDEVRLIVDGFGPDRDNDPVEAKKASQRVRKAISKLRAALREAKLDDHVLISRGGPNSDPEYSMIWRFPR